MEHPDLIEQVRQSRDNLTVVMEFVAEELSRLDAVLASVETPAIEPTAEGTPVEPSDGTLTRKNTGRKITKVRHYSKTVASLIVDALLEKPPGVYSSGDIGRFVKAIEPEIHLPTISPTLTLMHRAGLLECIKVPRQGKYGSPPRRYGLNRKQIMNVRNQEINSALLMRLTSERMAS